MSFDNLGTFQAPTLIQSVRCAQGLSQIVQEGGCKAGDFYLYGVPRSGLGTSIQLCLTDIKHRHIMSNGDASKYGEFETNAQLMLALKENPDCFQVPTIGVYGVLELGTRNIFCCLDFSKTSFSTGVNLLRSISLKGPTILPKLTAVFVTEKKDKYYTIKLSELLDTEETEENYKTIEAVMEKSTLVLLTGGSSAARLGGGSRSEDPEDADEETIVY